MSITTQRHESTQVTAAVSVRVPQNADGDLATDAQRRLRSVDAVHDATVTGFQNIDPRLSATVVTVVAEIETQGTVPDLHETLSDTVGIEAVQQLEEA